MRSALVLMCVATALLSACWAENPYSDLKISIFNRDDNIQTDFFEAVQDIERKFNAQFKNTDTEIRDAYNNLATALAPIPFVGAVFQVVASAISTVLKDPDWKEEVQKMIKKEIELANPINEVENMLKEFNEALQWMQFTEKTNPNYKDHVDKVYAKLQSMLSKFSDFASVSHQKPYPLVGSQLLIALSLAIAAFESTAVDVMPSETKFFTLPCQAYDLLQDYGSYAVDVRLNKLENIAEADISAVKLAPYNPDGYITDNLPPNCKNSQYYWNVDTFSGNSRYAHTNYDCRLGYAKHLRHQVEKVFPVKRLQQACQNEWPKREPSGLGYLTIRFIKVHAAELEDRHNCDSFWDDDCDSYVKLYVNGVEVFHTEPQWNAYHNEIDQVYTSKEIPKNSNITIKILDKDGGSSYETIMTVQDDIDGFLKQPVRSSSHSRKTFWSAFNERPDSTYISNQLVTAVFWKDTYNYLCSEPDMGGEDTRPFWQLFEGDPLYKPPPKKCDSSRLYQNVFTSAAIKNGQFFPGKSTN